jgi:hypothetical protein
MSKFSIDQQIEEVELELKYRRDVYARLVSAHKMRQSIADYRTARMEAVLETLKWNRDNRQHVIDLIRNNPVELRGSVR